MNGYALQGKTQVKSCAAHLAHTSATPPWLGAVLGLHLNPGDDPFFESLLADELGGSASQQETAAVIQAPEALDDPVYRLLQAVERGEVSPQSAETELEALWSDAAVGETESLESDGISDNTPSDV